MLFLRLPRRAFRLLPVPAVVDRVLNVLQMLLHDTSYEEDLDVMFDRGQFRIINPGLGREFLVHPVDLDGYRFVSEVGLAL